MNKHYKKPLAAGKRGRGQLVKSAIRAFSGKGICPLFLVLAIGALLMVAGCSGPAVVPTSYGTYSANDKSFKIQYPDQWQVEGGNRSGYAWAKFSSGGAEISVDANITGSLIGDISKSGIMPMGIEAGGEDRSSVAAVHQFEKKDFEADGTVKEQDPVTVQTGLGEAKKSEYTGKSTFGPAIHGYRVTALSSQKRIRVICQCPESEWEALKPAFDKVIASVSR